MRTRLETLTWLYAEAENALREAPADRKSALIGQLRGIAAEIDEIEGAQKQVSRASNPLEELLAKRQVGKTG